MSALDLQALRNVALSCRSVSEARAFYADAWGLEVARETDSRVWFRGSGPEHHILDFTASSGTGLRHIGFSVGTPGEVDEAATALAQRGVEIEFAPRALDEPGGGYGLGLRDPEGRLIVVSAGHDAADPRDTAAARPVALSHVVFNTTDLESAVEFWTGLLGLRVSDWSEDQMVFLRCNRLHHCVAFNRAEWTSVNHVAYDVPDLDGFMKSVGRMKRAGHEPLWGPGRHGPGNNAFAYFGDPVGYVPEVTTGLLEVEEDSWVPRVWQRVPEQSDLWGTAGPPTVEARERMAGDPDPSSPSAAEGDVR